MGVGTGVVADERNPADPGFDDPEPAPDRCLHDQIGDIAFGAHQPLQVGAIDS